MTSRAVPWSSTTVREPAPWWSPSMFCVMTPGLRPLSSSQEKARWAGFGSTGVAKNSCRISQLSRRTSGSAT